MSLIGRLTNQLQRAWPALFRRKPTTADETRERERVSRSPAVAVARFSADADRRESVLTCREMYRADPRARGVLRKLAHDAVKNGLQVQVAPKLASTSAAEAATAQQAANDLIERLKLTKRLDDWLRLTCRDGDSFIEVAVGDGNLIAGAARKPTLDTHRASNDLDEFDDPTRAFWYSDALWAGYGLEPPGNAIWFAQWQIIHARWEHDEGSRYGTPVFASATGAWKRIKEGEIDIAIRRKTRAGMKYLHSLEDADENDIVRYKEENQEALDNPFAAVADFFTNKKATIQTVQGDAHLADIADVMHHISTWWTASPVPMALLSYGENLNRDVLEEQKTAYDEEVLAVQDWLEDQIVRPLIELQWLLLGLWPGSYNCTVVWPKKLVVTPAMLKELGEALNRLQMTNLFPDEVLVGLIAEILPGVDVELIARYVKQQRAQQAEDRIASAGQETLHRLRGQQAEPAQERRR